MGAKAGAINDFKRNAKAADVALGSRSTGSQQSVARLWAYGHGDGGIGWPGLSSALPAQSGVREESVRVAREYLKSRSEDGEVAGQETPSSERGTSGSDRDGGGDVAPVGASLSTKAEALDGTSAHCSAEE